MESKCTNPNGEIILAWKINHVEIFFFKIVKIAFRNESYKLFFQKDAKIAWKTRLSITFS